MNDTVCKKKYPNTSDWDSAFPKGLNLPLRKYENDSTSLIFFVKIGIFDKKNGGVGLSDELNPQNDNII